MSINIDNVGFQYKGNDNLTTSYEWELKNCQDEYNQEKEYIDKEREELFKRRKEFEKKQKKVYWLFIIISIVILPYYNEVKALDRKSTRLNSSHSRASRMPSSA